MATIFTGWPFLKSRLFLCCFDIFVFMFQHVSTDDFNYHGYFQDGSTYITHNLFSPALNHSTDTMWRPDTVNRLPCQALGFRLPSTFFSIIVIPTVFQNFFHSQLLSISQKAVARASISVCFVRLLLRGREIARWGRLINVISFSSLELDLIFTSRKS